MFCSKHVFIDETALGIIFFIFEFFHRRDVIKPYQNRLESMGKPGETWLKHHKINQKSHESNWKSIMIRINN